LLEGQLARVRTALNEAQQQLLEYRAALNARYQEPQRLRCLAVVALGFDRLVWRVL
jgi:hypothetical protein